MPLLKSKILNRRPPLIKRGAFIRNITFLRKGTRKNKQFKNSLESDIENAKNVCFNLLDEDAEDDDFVDVLCNIVSCL